MRTLFLTLVPMLAVAAEPATLTGKVVSVHDGDTLRVLDAAGTQHKVRLQGIDAPETRQAFGTKARNRLADLTLRKVVRVNVHEHDRYGRVLAGIQVCEIIVTARKLTARTC